jgi:hypothetical protein
LLFQLYAAIPEVTFMKKIGFFLAVVFCVAMLSDKAHTANFISVQSGDWDNPLTWGSSPTGPIPGTGDVVTIVGDHTVSFASEVPINLSGIIVHPGGTLLLNRPLTLTGTYSSSGGIITGNSPLRTQGDSTINTGVISVGGVLVPLFTVPLEVVSGTTTAQGIFDGTITVNTGATLNFIQPGETPPTIKGDVTVNGVMSSSASLQFTGSVFINNGSVRATHINFRGITQSLNGSGVWATGTIAITEGATVSLGNPMTITVQRIDIAGFGSQSSLLINHPLSFTGDMRVQLGGTLQLNSPLTLTGTYSSTGGVIQGSSPLRVQGTSTVNAGASSIPLFTVPLEIINGTITASGIFDAAVSVHSGTTANFIQSGETPPTVNGDLLVNGTLGTNNSLQFRGSTFTNNGLIAVNVVFKGGAQTLTGAGRIFSRVSIFSGSTLTLGSNHQIDSLIINGGSTCNISSRTLSLSGEVSALVNNGSLITTGSTVLYNGTSTQTLAGSNIGYNNLTIDNPSGVFITTNETVNGVLTLNRGDLTIASSFSLTMPASASSTGSGDVIGNIKRTGFTIGSALSFGNPFNTIRFNSGVIPADVTVNLIKQVPISFLTSIARTYTIAANGGNNYSATVRLHYQEADLNGNQEATLDLWRFDGASWSAQGRTAFDSTSNWVEKSGVTGFSQWTLASANLPEDVVITHLTPDRGGNTGTVSTMIHGRGFEQGIIAKLSRTGQPDILGSPTSVAEDGRSISVSFNLIGKQQGLWDVVATNPNGTLSVLFTGFTIEDGLAAQLWMDMIGRNVMRVGRTERFSIFYGNRGNIDAADVILWLAVPRDVKFTVDVPYLDDIGLAPQDVAVLIGDYIYIWFYADNLRALETRSFSFFLNNATNQSIEIRGGILKGTLILQQLSLQTSPRTKINSIAELNIKSNYVPQSSRLFPRVGANHIPSESFLIPGYPEPKVGDIVFKLSDLGEAPTGHVGIYIGNGNVIDFVTKKDPLEDGKPRVKQLEDWAMGGTYRGSGKPFELTPSQGMAIAQAAVDYYTAWERGGKPPIPYRIFPDAEHQDCVSFVNDCYRTAGFNLPWSDWSSPGAVYERVTGKIWPEKIYRLYRLMFSVTKILLPMFADPIAHSEVIRNAILLVTAIDPNSKIGSSGAGGLRYFSGDEPLRYAIYFENVATATAPAQEVVITDQLDITKIDLSTFSFGAISFGEKNLLPSPGLSEFVANVDLRPENNLIVDVDAHLNTNNGLITWKFTSIDPATGQPPEDPLAGFLPPNISPPKGEGSVFFTVMPKENLSTGTEIRNRAKIIFDANAPIDTPEWFNTMDNTKPVSQVLPLASTQCKSFQVNWAGSDSGSGILDYSVYVSENNGPFTVWLQNTTATAAAFTGQSGRTYAFYSVARDKTGNPEDAPTIADVTVAVNDTQPPSISCAGNISKPQDKGVCTAVVTYAAPTVSDNCSGVGKPICNPASGSIFPTGSTTVTCSVADGAGNQSSCNFTVTVTDTVAPTINCPANIVTTTALNQCARAVSFSVTASDQCSGVTIVSNPPSGTNFPMGTTTVTSTATDSAGNTANCTFTVTVNDNQPPTISCPVNLVKANDLNFCSAVVTYTAPIVSDNCQGVVSPICSPASGATFPKGTTTVICTVSDVSGNSSSCNFTVTVNDMQVPVITCPANITAVAGNPNNTCVLVNYPTTATDNCAGVSRVCNPPSGSCFPPGVTTVNCTATDTSGNAASCSFTVTTFDLCLQEDSNNGTVLLVNSTMGDYRFCCAGSSYSGRGIITRRGNLITLEDNSASRRLLAKADKSTNKATASLQAPPGTIICTLTDQNIANNSCNCALSSLQ